MTRNPGYTVITPFADASLPTEKQLVLPPLSSFDDALDRALADQGAATEMHPAYTDDIAL